MRLFSTITVGNLRLRNRVVMAPMSGNQANPDGTLGGEVADYYGRRARGGAALIVTEGLLVPVAKPGGASPCSTRTG